MSVVLLTVIHSFFSKDWHRLASQIFDWSWIFLSIIPFDSRGVPGRKGQAGKRMNITFIEYLYHLVTEPNTLQIFISFHPHFHIQILVPYLDMRKLSSKTPLQGFTGSKWKFWNLNSGLSDPRVHSWSSWGAFSSHSYSVTV